MPATQLSPLAAPDGESRTLDVIAAADCAWQAQTGTNFLAITGPTLGRGNGTLTLRIDGNTGAERSGTLAINAKNFTIVQAARPVLACTFRLSTTTQSFDATGGVGSIDVTVTQGLNCTWTATSNSSFITVTGVGTGTMTFSVAPNSGDSRTGTLTIAGQMVTISQVGRSGPPNRCDLNGDSKVDVEDVNIIRDAVLSGSHDAKFDINRDGQVNVADVQTVVNATFNPASCPP